MCLVKNAMLSFNLKDKIKIQKKGGSPNGKNEPSKSTVHNLKQEMISAILKKNNNKGKSDQPVTFADASLLELESDLEKQPTIQNIESKSGTQATIQNIESKSGTQATIQSIESKSDTQATIQSTKTASKTKTSSHEATGVNNEKITNLIKIIESTKEKMVTPSIDLENGEITYPLLAQIDVETSNLDFLENLASPSIDILDRTIYERFVVCPQHPDSFSVNVRLYCPKCQSTNIEKLHLIEHRRCGHISERKNFEIASDGTIAKCPSCNKQIRDMKREIAIPAMWYECSECRDKFDDVIIKLHCRKFNHDFDTNQSHTIMIPGFTIKNLADNSNSSISPILDKLKKLLSNYGFSSEENYTVTGKSGNHHNINIYGVDSQNRTIFIFIKNPNAANDNSELNSKIIQVLDTNPSITILIGFPTISEKAKSITSNYNISLVTEQKPDEVLSSIDKILSEKVSTLGA